MMNAAGVTAVPIGSLEGSWLQASGLATMFEVNRPFMFADYLRIPHRVVDGADGPGSPLVELRAAGGGTLRWPRWDRPSTDHSEPAPAGLGDVPVFARIATDSQAQSWLGPGWERAEPLLDLAGAARARGSVWRDGSGGIFLPFDPDEAILNYWSEAYGLVASRSAAGRAKRASMRAYYKVRPILPRSVQIALRRKFSRIQARSRFPRWPIETGLLDLYNALFGLLAELAGEPVPWLAPWPDGYSWAVVLTHDVEADVGYRNIHVLRDVEVAHGYRSSWNLVPLRYAVEDAVVAELWSGGFEVGVHGLYHDGRDLESRATLGKRLPAMRDAAERWGAHGFRSPATHRSWELMPLLGFDYDSSYPDTDPFEPQAGGCCSLLPFFNGDLVELPITLPQDHTVFVILRHQDEAIWLEKAEFIRGRGGLALLITHPDYFVDGKHIGSYERFLSRFADDPTAWRALPHEVSEWWRRRAASSLELTDGEWRIVGPAAQEGRVTYFVPANEHEYEPLLDLVERRP
jgi:hypothetical protein